MVNMKRLAGMILAGQLLAGPLAAQETLPGRARFMNDSVVLRWAPARAEAWQSLNRYGYRLERVEIPGKEATKVLTQRIGPDTLKPWPPEKWKQQFAPDHKFAAMAVQALYGQSFGAAPDPSNFRTVEQAAQEAELRWSLSLLAADLDAGVASGLGLRWADKTAQGGKRYLYRVIALDPLHPDTAVAAVDCSIAPEPVPAPERLRAEEKERAVTLAWDALPEMRLFTAWWIERSPDGRNWTRLNKSPYLHSAPPEADQHEIFFSDTTLPGNYIPFYYRVRGITPFAEISPPSEAIRAMGRDRTPPAAPEIGKVEEIKGKLIVAWMPGDKPDDLVGFRIEKASDVRGPFYPLHKGLLKPSERRFTDPSEHFTGQNHYRVFAVDTAGNEAVSLSAYGTLQDSIPPAPPTGLSGHVDSTGMVHLRWRLGPEEDLLGYRVFFANAPDHEFSNISPEPLQDTVFSYPTTLRTLSKRIYYKLVAVDRNFNHSGFSSIFAVERPDTIAPPAPLFSNYQVSDTSVVLSIVPSTAKDLARHELLRRNPGQQEWKLLKSWRANETVTGFTDQQVEGPAFYEYAIQAIDSSGNKGRLASPLGVRVYKRVYRKEPPAGFRAVYNPAKKQAELSWAPPSRPVKFYVVYRAKNGSALLSYSNAEATERSFTDNRLTGPGTYTYSLKIVYADGESSLLAPEQRVVVE